MRAQIWVVVVVVCAALWGMSCEKAEDSTLYCGTRSDCPAVESYERPYDCIEQQCTRRDCTSAYDCSQAGMGTSAGCEGDGTCVDCYGPCYGDGACACGSSGDWSDAIDAPDTTDATDTTDTTDAPDAPDAPAEPDGADADDTASIDGAESDTDESDADAGAPDLEAACVASGGTVTSALCCTLTEPFPDLCSVGGCSCGPADSAEIATCDCGEGRCFDGATCVAQ